MQHPCHTTSSSFDGGPWMAAKKSLPGEVPRANFPSRNDPKSPSPRRLAREMGGATACGQMVGELPGGDMHMATGGWCNG